MRSGVTRGYFVLFLAILVANGAFAFTSNSTGLQRTLEPPSKNLTKLTSALRAALSRLISPQSAQSGLVGGATVRLGKAGRMEIFVYVDSITPERLEALRSGALRWAYMTQNRA